MKKASPLQRFLHKAKNLSFIRPFLEKNRWITAFYFNWRYRRPDPYNYARSGEECVKRERILALLQGRCYKRILSVGCGEGYQSGVLASLGDSLLGIDISKTAVKRARKIHQDNPSVSFMRADVLTFRTEETFDLITCCDVLYYMSIPQIKKAVWSLSGILAPGGHLLAVDIFTSAESGEHGLDLKNIGAGTIHPLLREIPGLKAVSVKRYPGYEMLLLEKTESPA